jgi:hypothetical protein
VQLEVEEHRPAATGLAALHHGVGTVTEVELEADLDRADVRPRGGSPADCLLQVTGVQRHRDLRHAAARWA